MRWSIGLFLFEAQAGWVKIIFLKSAKGCKRLQVNAIACRICRENQEGLARAFGAGFEALFDG